MFSDSRLPLQAYAKQDPTRAWLLVEQLLAGLSHEVHDPLR